MSLVMIWIGVGTFPDVFIYARKVCSGFLRAGFPVIQGSLLKDWTHCVITLISKTEWLWSYKFSFCSLLLYVDWLYFVFVKRFTCTGFDMNYCFFIFDRFRFNFWKKIAILILMSIFFLTDVYKFLITAQHYNTRSG